MFALEGRAYTREWIMNLIRRRIEFLLTILVCCTSAHAEGIAVAGKLAVDLHAELLVANNDQGHALNWYNCGSLWGTFGNFGFDGPPEQYPKLGKVGGIEAVTFNGDDFLKADFKTSENFTGSSDFSVEVWALNPSTQKNECIVSWGGAAQLFYGDRQPESGKWHHMAIVFTGENGEEKLYVDGKPVSKKKVMLNLSADGTIIIGCDALQKNHFTGSIAALRIHDSVMTDEQVAHNFKGGSGLGTKLLANIHPKPRGATFADHNAPEIEARFSKHYRTAWFKKEDAKGVMAERVPKQLKDAEYYYDFYSKTLGMHLPIVSDKIENRGDGKKYLIEICNNWKGGNYGGHMPHGFGYPIQGSGFFSGHELGHACQMHSMGSFPGNWWEAHGNWMPEAAGRPHVHPGLNNLTSMFFAGNGRHYYHSWLIFQHLAQTSEYGPLFVAKMWHNCKRGEFLWDVARRIDPVPTTPMADEWVKMARRNITWDYKEHERYITANTNPDLLRYGRVQLEPLPLEPGWHRVPWELAPQQFGYNLCPLKPTAEIVTVDFQGYVNPERGSDWRACLVAVSGDGNPRYGSIWSKGKNSFKVEDGDKELYLVISATPTKIMTIGHKTPYRSLEQHSFPYKVSLKGAEPLDVLDPGQPNVKGHAHPNGGGFVADTASIESTAYVGPNAQVLDQAKAMGGARVEDFAIVRGRAVVRDRAVIRGHALVEGDVVVRDDAKVRDFAKVGGKNTVRDSAKFLEHASFRGNGKAASGFAVAKGMANVRGNIGGTAIADGSYAKTNDLTRGFWFTWSWGAGKNPGEVDREFAGLYAEYRFEEQHPYLALDTHGITHGYLHGAPEIAALGSVSDPKTKESMALMLNGKDQFVELHRDVADMRDFTVDIKLFRKGSRKDARLFEFAQDKENVMFLTPADGNGKLKFVIRRDGKEQVLKDKTGLPSGQCLQVQVMLSGNTGRLFVNGALVDRNDGMTLNPEDIRATICLLGRGLSGNYFEGLIDRFSIYSNSLVDDVPPAPNPAQWVWQPTLVSPDTAVMRSVVGNDPRGQIEYFFEETSDNPGGDDSGWQKATDYRDAGLNPGTSYAYRLKMRDVNGNETKSSEIVSLKWKSPKAFIQEDSVEGLVIIEAEHFSLKIDAPDGHQWNLMKKKEGFSGEGTMQSLPNNGANRVSDFAGQSPRLDYHVKFTKTGQHWLWVRSHGPGYTNDSIHAAINLKPEKWGQNFSTGWGDNYKWMRRGPFKIDQPGIHSVSIWMREDGTILDKLLLTTSADYKPSKEIDEFRVPVGKGPTESPKSP